MCQQSDLGLFEDHLRRADEGEPLAHADEHSRDPWMSGARVPVHGDVVDSADPVAVRVHDGSAEKVCQGDHLTGDHPVRSNHVSEAGRDTKTPSLLVCSVLIGHWPLLARCHRFPRTSLPPMVIVRHAAQTLRGLEEIVGAHPPSDQGPGSPGRVRLCRTRRTAGWPFHARSFLRSRLEQLPLRSLLPATRRGLLHQEGLTPLGGRVRGVLPPIARSGSHRAAPSS